MAFYSNLDSFKTAIGEFLDIGSAISHAKLDDLIRVGENRVVKELRVRDMETALSATIGSTAGTASVPSDYLDMKYAYVNSSPIRRLERKSPGWIYEKFPDRTSGDERYFAREGNEFIFGEGGTPGRVVKGIYYAKPTAMSSTINSLFSAYPEVYLFATLAEAGPYVDKSKLGDVQLWEQKYQMAVRRANQMDKDELYSGSPLSSTVS